VSDISYVPTSSSVNSTVAVSPDCDDFPGIVHEYPVIVPSGSVDADPLNVTVNGGEPDVGVAVAVAVGIVFGGFVTTTEAVSVVDAPSESVTVTDAVSSPVSSLPYVRFTVCPVARCPPGSVHSYDRIVPSGSEELDASNVTSTGASPDDGVAVALAVGGVFGGCSTLMDFRVWSVAPSLSVTVSSTVTVPISPVVNRLVVV
jgi:hypothetical protein